MRSLSLLGNALQRTISKHASAVQFRGQVKRGDPASGCSCGYVQLYKMCVETAVGGYIERASSMFCDMSVSRGTRVERPAWLYMLRASTYG